MERAAVLPVLLVLVLPGVFAFPGVVHTHAGDFTVRVVAPRVDVNASFHHEFNYEGNTVMHHVVPPGLLIDHVSRYLEKHGFKFASHDVELTVENNAPVYKFRVAKHVKFLGIIPLEITADLYCSASVETSENVQCEVRMNPIVQLIYLLSAKD